MGCCVVCGVAAWIGELLAKIRFELLPRNGDISGEEQSATVYKKKGKVYEIVSLSYYQLSLSCFKRVSDKRNKSERPLTPRCQHWSLTSVVENLYIIECIRLFLNFKVYTKIYSPHRKYGPRFRWCHTAFFAMKEDLDTEVAGFPEEYQQGPILLVSDRSYFLKLLTSLKHLPPTTLTEIQD